MRRLLVLFTLATVPAAFASSLTIGAPADSGTGDCAPFGCALRYQQVYSSSLFTGGMTITDLTFFINELPGGSIDPTTYFITLSTTSMAVNSLNADFVSNIGADQQVFFNSALSGAVGTQFAISGTPFFYNPANGNLLLNVTKSSGGAGTVFMDDREGTAGGSMSRLVSFSSAGPGAADSDYGLVTRFTFFVPEPDTVSLLGGGLLALGLVFRRRIRRA